MKYFTKTLWVELQDEIKYEETKIKWERAIEAYQNQFEELKSRLPVKVYKFFKENSFHDGKIISIKLCDEYIFNRMKDPECDIINQPISMKIQIINGFSEYIYTLEYSNIIKFNFTHSIENPLFKHFYDGFGDIGYDELTMKDDIYLKHEYLFSTGNTLEIEFKKIQVYRKRFA